MKLKQLKKDLQYEALLLPAFILYLVFVIIPFIVTFFFSITNYNKYHINNYHIVGLKNYLQILDIPMLKVALVNSLKYALLMTFFQSLIAIPLSSLLNRKMKLSNFYRAAFFLPAMFSPLVMGFLWQVMLGPKETGLVNQFLIFLHLPTGDFLSAKSGMNSVIFTQVWQWVGWAVVIYLANMKNISEDMLEAARIDGASGLQVFFRITLPLLQPAVTVVFVSSLIGGLKVYDIIQAMTKGGPGYSTETILTAMIKIGFTQGNYALSAAFGVVFFVLVMIVTMLLLKVLKAWESAVS
jgi:ABC-type sugar transport systems, permease components